MTFLALQS